MSAEMITGWSYFGVRNPRHVATDLDDMVKHNANAVLLTVSEEDNAFYRDTMRELTSLAHERGMTVYMNPWAYGGVFGGEAFSGFLPRHPEAMQIDSKGEPVPAACLNNRAFREYLFEWIETVASCGADVAMWDEPHFFIFGWDELFAAKKDRWTCRCLACQTAFEARFGHKMPQQMTPEVRQFRHESIVNFLDEMTTRAKARGLKNSICILPFTFNLDDGVENLDDIFRLSSVDILATDPYWDREHGDDWVREHYTRNAEILVQNAQKFGVEPEIWIKNFKIAAGQEHLVELATEIGFDAGIRRILAWSYLGSAYMSYLRSDNPLEVYERQAQAFRLCHQKAAQE